MASGSTLAVFSPQQATFPTSNYPTFDVRNTHLVLDFDAGTDETCYFEGVLPSNYTGLGVTVRLFWMTTSGTGDVCWSIAWERHADDAFDLDGDSFGAEGTSTSTSATVSGELKYTDITFTHGSAMASVSVNEHFRLRVFRDANNVADTLAADAELIGLSIRET